MPVHVRPVPVPGAPTDTFIDSGHPCCNGHSGRNMHWSIDLCCVSHPATQGAQSMLRKRSALKKSMFSDLPKHA